MTPESRRELLLATIELSGAGYAPGSAAFEVAAAQWDEVSGTVSGALLDEDRLVELTVKVIRVTARELRGVVQRYGPGGPVVALFDEQAAALAQVAGLTRSRTIRTQAAHDKAEQIRDLAAKGLSQGQVAAKTGFTRKTVYRDWAREKP